MRHTDDHALWAASFLKGDVYIRMEPYIAHRLEAGYIDQYNDEVKKVIIDIDGFLEVLAQLYGDLDKARTSELQLMELRQ
jgi:hypothetical protein